MFKIEQESLDLLKFLETIREKLLARTEEFFGPLEVGFSIGWETAHKDYVLFAVPHLQLNSSRDEGGTRITNWAFSIEADFRMSLNSNRHSRLRSNELIEKDLPAFRFIELLNRFIGFFLDLELLEKNPLQNFIIKRSSLEDITMTSGVLQGSLRLDFERDSYSISAVEPFLREKEGV